MDIEQALKSNDIEIVQLAVNILLKDSNIIHIEDILAKTIFRVDSFDRNYITLKNTRKGLYEQIKKGNYTKVKKFDEKTIRKLMKKIFK